MFAGRAIQVTIAMAAILLVDDFDDYAETLAFMLRHWGHTVEVARTGAEAIVRRDRPDVVLLEIGLPDMTGYNVAKRLREEFGAATPRLIAVTGYGQPNDVRRCHEAGFERHLLKPVDPNELRAVIEG